MVIFVLKYLLKPFYGTSVPVLTEDWTCSLFLNRQAELKGFTIMVTIQKSFYGTSVPDLTENWTCVK